MSKRHKGPSTSSPESQSAARGEDAKLDHVDVDVAVHGALGNAAFQAAMGQGQALGIEDDLLATLSGARQRAVDGSAAERAVIALRLMPRPDAEQERLLEIICSSRLPDIRREALAERLGEDQQIAVWCRDVLQQALGPMDEALRSRWTAVFLEVSSQGTVTPEAVGPAVATAAQRVGLSADANAVTQMCSALMQRALLREDEEEAAGVDYATEESGV